MPPMLEITTGDFRFLARFEEELAPQTVAAFRRILPFDDAHHPLPLERRVELDSLGRPRPRDRAGERDLVPAPGRARSLPGRSKRNGAALSLRVLLLRVEGGTPVGEPLCDARRGAGAAQRAGPAHPLGRRAGDHVPRGLMLYRPEAFEPLVDTPWSETRARAAIRSIVEDADAAFRGPRLFWRANEWDGWHGTSPMKNLYVGTRRSALGSRPPATARLHGDQARPREPRAAQRRVVSGATRLHEGHEASGAPGLRAAHRGDGSSSRRLAPVPEPRARGRTLRARAGQRRQRGRRGDVGNAGHAARRPGDARVDRGRAVAGRVERERGRAPVTP